VQLDEGEEASIIFAVNLIAGKQKLIFEVRDNVANVDRREEVDIGG